MCSSDLHAPYTLNTSTVATEFPGITLWLDAADSSTIVTGTGNEINTWANKIDSAIKMHGATDKPDTGGSINGINALEFDGVANGIKEGIYARKNTSTAWSPAGNNGAASGTYNELVLAFVWRFNGNGQVSDFDTFNLGFGKHFYGWGNTGIWWQYPSNNVDNISWNPGTAAHILVLQHSVSNTTRQVWQNGTSLGSKNTSNVTAPTIGGEFFFPSYQSGAGYYYDITLGEVLAIKGTMTDSVREKIEGYLGHKWGIGLGSGHTWADGSPYSDVAPGADLTLYWGSTDGGTTASSWDNEVSIGKKKPRLAIWLDANDASSFTLSGSKIGRAHV